MESRLELTLLDAFEDDEEATATADAGAGEPAVSLQHLLPTAPPASAAYDPVVRRLSSGAGPSAARAAAAPLLPPLLPIFAPAGRVVRKTAHENVDVRARRGDGGSVGFESGRQRPGDGRWQLSLQPA